jgi:hypothetical protein
MLLFYRGFHAPLAPEASKSACRRNQNFARVKFYAPRGGELSIFPPHAALAAHPQLAETPRLRRVNCSRGEPTAK